MPRSPTSTTRERPKRVLSLLTWAASVIGSAVLPSNTSMATGSPSRVHGDDTTVPMLAVGKTDIGRSWVCVRDDRPFAGPAPPAAVFYYSRDRGGTHPQTHLARYAGILQADAYGGYAKLYESARQPGPIIEAACWSHARRKFFVLADLAASAQRKAQGKTPAFVSPVALEAVRRIDALFAIERDISGKPADARLTCRQDVSLPLVNELHAWMREERTKLSRHNDVAKAMDYMLNRWTAFTRFLDDGRVCLSNNPAERALRGIALGRKSWLFAGSDRGGQRAAMMYSLIVTAKMNDVDPQAWLADVALDMDPEDGQLTVYGLDDDGTIAFTAFGIENLKELIEIHKASPDLLERYRKPE